MPTGRQPHEAKITIYLSEEEALELEEFKLGLRKKGVKADRSRIVRAMIEVGLQRDKDVNRLLKKGD